MPNMPSAITKLWSSLLAEQIRGCDAENLLLADGKISIQPKLKALWAMSMTIVTMSVYAS